MNFKHIFPSFRNRYRFVQACLKDLTAKHAFTDALNLGTGEGDYDRMIAAYCQQLVACDVNAEDIAHAAAMNKGVMNLRYECNDALKLSYPDGHFDLLISSEVIEHVGDPALMMQEIARVLRPGGYAVLTFPSREFPFTYDPVNRIGQWIGRKAGKKPLEQREFVISQGAYAFGHEYLIGAADFKQWAADAGLEIQRFKGLSHHLVGLLEMYWTGLAQSMFKKNARNLSSDKDNKMVVRPGSTREPALAIVTDALLALDRLLFGWSARSLGKGVVLQKK